VVSRAEAAVPFEPVEYSGLWDEVFELGGGQAGTIYLR
jgi:hypothetical protein